MLASDLLVKCLENEGVKYIFSIPGEETIDLIESIRKSSIRLITLRHEQEAGFMAATVGRLTGRPGVCLVTLGPGATNLVTPIVYAQLGSMPMVSISGQKPIKIHQQGDFQVVDVVSMMKPITKISKQILDIRSIPSLVRYSFEIAQEERPGVVHLELPEDVAQERLDHITVLKKERTYKPNADYKAISRCVEMIESAKSPLILVGSAANRTSVSDLLTYLINKFEIPFFCTQMGKGVVSEHNKYYLGTASISSGDLIHKAIDKADLIINIGHSIIEKPPFRMNKISAKVIHINFFSPHIDNTYFPHLVVKGDILFSVRMIGKSLNKMPHWNFKKFCSIKKAFEEQLQKANDDYRFPLSLPKLVSVVQEKLCDNDILTLDNGLYKLWFARNYKAHNPNSILLDNALATMGAGLPSSMAVKLLYPQKKVVAICGDGGFLMNMQAMESAKRLNLDLTILVLNDSAYGMVLYKQKERGLKTHGTKLGNPCFVKLADSFGAKGYCPKSVEEFEAVLQKTLKEPGINLIDVAINYELEKQIIQPK